MRRRWRRALAAAVLAASSVATLAAVLVLAAGEPASAHPLGNFTSNTYSGLSVRVDRVVVDYVVDLAEIPAFQTRQKVDANGDGTVSPAEQGTWSGRECRRLASGLRLRREGRRLAVRSGPTRLTFPPGAADLPTLRLECRFEAPMTPLSGAQRLDYRDPNFADRVGWHEVTAVGEGTELLRSDVPSQSTSERLARYADGVTPPRQITATLAAAPGAADGRAKGASDQTDTETPPKLLPRRLDRATRALTSLVSSRRPTPGFALVALAVAFGLGGMHALAPGHGKTVMAAYVVGRRGSLRQGLTIGLTVAATHTAGVLALGIALSTSQVLAPEAVYPWLGLASGLLLAGVGAGLMRSALRRRHDHHHGHVHHYGHDHDHEDHDHEDHDHEDHHRGLVGAGRESGWRSVVAMGLAGGLVPTPSALVVLLGAVALGRTWLGVFLVTAYGLGMAATLVGTGLLLARAGRVIERRSPPVGGARRARQLPLATMVRALPVAAAAVVTLGGVLVAAGAVAGL